MSKYMQINNTIIRTTSIVTATYIPKIDDENLRYRYLEEGLPTESRVFIVYDNGYSHSIDCTIGQYNSLMLFSLGLSADGGKAKNE